MPAGLAGLGFEGLLSRQSDPWLAGETLGEHLRRRGVSRRDFARFCGQVALTLGVGTALTPSVAKALQRQRKPTVVWLELQECTGCVEATVRANEPTLGNLLLDVVSLDYSDTLMAAAGDAAEHARETAMKENFGKYLLIVTGSVPMLEGGMYTTIAGRTAHDHLVEAAKGAAAIIALGACAHFGSVQAAKPNPTGAKGVREIITDRPVLNIAGCPPVPDVIVATVVHFLTFGKLPKADSEGRPLFAYGARIHDQCPRRGHFDAGQFAHTFDDAGARQGWCLYEVGCKGPQTFSPCPIFMWNEKTSWPIGAGHPCIGCTEPYFWDTMSPFYQRLPGVTGFGIEKSVDTIGLGLLGATAGGVAVHAAWTFADRARRRQLPIYGQQPPAGGDVGAPPSAG
ncbi:MAG: hydrogenase small subunit [Gemmatimonadales bacterium]|nr:hydrogenase small subunit [Gemmatimonadales bacterium]